MADPNDPERSTPLEEDGIRYENPAAGVARVVLARPEARNAQDKAMLYGLNAAFDRAAHDDAIKVIVLSADGPHFSSGHDLRDQSKIADFEPVGNWGGAALPGAEGHMAVEQEIYLGLCWRWRNLPKPTIAQVHGKQQLGHSHNQQVFNLPVDPSGVGIIRKQAKGDT